MSLKAGPSAAWKRKPGRCDDGGGHSELYGGAGTERSGRRGCLSMHGGVKQTAAQAGPQERSNTPSTPVRVRPAASAWRTVAVRFQGSSADSPTICHSLCPSPQLLPPTLTDLEDEVSDDSFTSSEEPEDYRPRPHSGPGPVPESSLPRRL